MTPINSDELLIGRLLDLPVAGRALALELACTDDPAIRDRLPAIMAALVAKEDCPKAEPGERLSPESMVLFLKSALDIAPTEVPGTRIGHYKLLQEIGRGGFGVVWMAEQEEPIRRRVALKIIKTGMDTHEVIVRFEAERQALALMDHPNIARVFDAGATETGRPFFVMELVRGVAITRYCDDNRLPPEARLRLFIAVCQAVQHAHQKGVIHRDLKPSNILVTLHDGVPVPKIIDFGIAKATSGVRLTDKTLFTQFHAFIGTPAYTSPEQMEMSGLDVDTRSDVYSLGVLLYELLAGRPPFDSEALLKSGLEAMRRTIREIDPPRPSHCLRTLTESARTSVAQQRSTDAMKLSVLLRGDLDWIVMRCLEKDRTHRYETANGLARDIQRHLESEPVTARPPGGVYRLKKFIRRHRVGFAAATAVAVSLVAGLIVSSVLFLRERTARARAVSAEQTEVRLRQQAETAREQETKRASQTALDLGERLLTEGKTGEALAYFVEAARKNPSNATIAPRLASALVLRNFLIPRGAPLAGGARVIALRYTRDGHAIHAGAEDGTFRIFDPATGAVRSEFHLGGRVKRDGWIFPADNDQVFAVTFADNTLAVFDVGSSQPRWTPIALNTTVAARTGATPSSTGIEEIKCSADGRWLRARSLYDVWLWDALTGELRLQHTFSNYHFDAFSPDGKRFANASDERVHVWSLPECVETFAPVANERHLVTGVYLIPQFSPDGKTLAVCDPWEAIHVLDAVTGEHRRTIPHPDNWIIPGAINFLPDGRLFMACANSSELWDLTTGKSTPVPVVWRDTFARNMPSADGRIVATKSTDATLQLWSAATGQLVVEGLTFRNDQKACAALSPDGTVVAIGTSGGTIRRLRVGGGAARPLELRGLAAPFVDHDSARVMWFSADRARAIELASGREIPGGFAYPRALHEPQTFQPSPNLQHIVVLDHDGRWESWEPVPGGVARAMPLHSAVTWDDVRFDATGDSAAFFDEKNAAFGVWDLRTGGPRGPAMAWGKVLPNPFTIDFSPDGTRLAAGHGDGQVAIWEVATGRPQTTLQGTSEAGVTSVRFSPDGQRVLTTNDWREAGLWDSHTGYPLGPPLNTADGDSTVFSPDGRWFAIGGARTVRLWDARTAQPVGRTIPVGAYRFFYQFSHDGTRLVIPDRERNLRVWDVPSGLPVTEATHPADGGLGRAGFSPDGRFVRVESNHSRFLFSSVPPPAAGVAAPTWLLTLATICAGQEINDGGEIVEVERDAQIDNVRRELAALPTDEPLAEWGRWFLDDSPTRSIAPGFTITPAEAGKLAAQPAPITPSSP